MVLRLLLIATLLLSACATNPVTKQSDFVLMSEKQELQLGRQAAAEVAKQMVLLPETDPLAQYVNRVGQKVAAVSDRPDLFYRFYVVDDKTINAFALPGGYIYIHRGLLIHLNSEAELAAVLGHEIGHVTARHAVKRYTQAQAYNLGLAVTSIFVPIPQGSTQLTDLLALAVIQGYGRDAELQADELSLKYISRAGYDPRATIGILETLKRLDELDSLEKKDAGEKVEKYHGAFASHPEDRVRIEQAVAKYAHMHNHGGIVDRMDMIRAVDGYPYGDSPAQGAVIGRRFIHPDLGIQLQFPPDWVIQNSPQALNARLRQEKVFFQLHVRDLNKRQSAAEILHDLFPDRHMGPITTGNQAGLPYARSVITMSAPHVSQAAIDARVFLKGARAFIMLMWCQRDQFGAHVAQFERIAGSLQRYDKARDGGVPRIHLTTWKPGDSWQKEAAASHNILGRFTAQRLAALNGMGINQHPQPNTLIKTVR